MWGNLPPTTSSESHAELSVIFSANSVDHTGIRERKGGFFFASVLGEHGSGGDNGQDQGIDERIGRQGRHGAAEIRIHNLGRADGENLSVLVRIHFFGLENADQANFQIEGIGFRFRGFHFDFQGDEIQFIVFSPTTLGLRHWPLPSCTGRDGKLNCSSNGSRSSFTRANQNKDYRIFEEYAFWLVSEVRKKYSVEFFQMQW